ncbi:MAG: hypothetical protein IIY04_00440 [Oscillospiraceae bacterium]|nr:hypothetical protein [Oscillospiraceae bacterium]
MPVSRLKNLIILILALTAAFLLALVVPTKLAQMDEAHEMRLRLKTLFASYGVSLDAQSLPQGEPLCAVEIAEPESGAQAAAQVLLGKDAVRESSSRHRSVYTSPNGVCSFGAAGSFEALLTGRAPVSDVRKDAADLLEKLGFDFAWVDAVSADPSGKQQVLCAQSLGGVPIFSSGLVLEYQDGVLTSISGQFFPNAETLTPIGARTTISCADALVSLLSSRDTLGWVGSHILALKQVYRYTDTAAATLRFVPVWLIETDTDRFFVNAVTGEVSLDAAAS